MRFNSLGLIAPGVDFLLVSLTVSLAASLSGCANEDGSNHPKGGTVNGYSLPPMSGPNILTLTVNGTNCSSNSYTNKPCVTVQLCPPGSSTGCQTINDILLDTGSFGLRVFKQAITSNLLASFTPITSGGQPVAECVRYGDGSKDWGPIQTAGIILGSEPRVDVPIQVIDSTFANSSTYCRGAETEPASAGFNGILGVGLFAEDCGTGCANHTQNGLYYACNGSTCSGTTVSLTNQVQNPVAALPIDNNGVIVELPLIPLGGASSANGYLVLGIGTQSNNTPADVTLFPASPMTGDFTTTFEGQTFVSFLDTGSNGYFFPSSMPNCSSFSSGLAGWYCPLATTALSASNTGSSGSPTSSTLFQISNLTHLDGSNHVFIDIGGDAGDLFDWGLPFHLGRNVYVGFADRSSSLGTGPYWAY